MAQIFVSAWLTFSLALVAQIFASAWLKYSLTFTLGIDVYAAEIVLDLKTKYPYITQESAIPCETQAVKWSVAARERYYNIAAKCDKETMLQREYTPGCMEKRNQYMVDHADYILAVWNGRPSGTGNTVRYAQKKGKFVIVIDPVSLDVKRE